MTLHKEGTVSLVLAIAFMALCWTISLLWLGRDSIVGAFTIFVGTAIFFIILQFFRKPKRKPKLNDNIILCPADGKVVAIEEIEETEFFNGKRIQVSIFMSPLNVHINWLPISGKVVYDKYHPGKFLVAWHPKSSTDNERTTIVVENNDGVQVLFRQIAGALARRIVYYTKENTEVNQGDEFGFIKFGSRIDLLLPLSAKINVAIDDKVVGTQTQIAELS